MDESEVQSDKTPVLPGGSSSSPPASSSRGSSWVNALTGAAVLVLVVVRLAPMLARFLGEAFELLKLQTQAQMLALATAKAAGICALPVPCTCGWEKWIPSFVVGAIILGAVAPTAFRDLKGAFEAIKGLLPAGKK